MDFKGMLSILCTITTIGLFLSGSRVCQKILRQGNTQNVSIMPFLSTFINCIMWLKYGILKPDGLLMLVNATGATLAGIYLVIYYLYAQDKDKIHRSLLYGGFLLYSVLVYVKFYLEDIESSLSTLGPVGICTMVMMFGSPLSTVAQVCRTKSTESVPFAMSLATFLTALEWLVYGRIVGDFYIEFPNFLGSVLGLIQLLLFVWYPSTPSHVKGSTGPTSTV
ncbi:sugar transporter SWEET1-like isoform X2 [Amphiura filiformis]|uniref:sugar transporter SWEET1-like isoform X2 n=1 Tax=Amphiura filiformis TaxID=82378 RepID=UPI003B21221B